MANPFPTVDIIIEIGQGIVLIERVTPPPFGWAISGGFGVKIELMRRYQKYSDPSRDFRQHNISTVFFAKAIGAPKAGTDAKQAQVFKTPPKPLVFDHAKILEDYYQWLEKGRIDIIQIKPEF